MDLLAPLAAQDLRFLADRRWPGSRTAQVDLVAVGPQGVFIIDTKHWKEPSVVGDRMYRGDPDVTEEILNLADLMDKAEAELAEIGLAPGEVHAVAVLAFRKGISARVGPVDVVGDADVLSYIAARGARLTPSQVDAVYARCMVLFPVLGAPAPVVATVPEPVLAAPPATVDMDALLSESEVEAALLAGVMAQPIEEWMSFLHPIQATTVRRSFNGPGRVRGPAGTGKTVVGLHRAAYLARTRPGKVLVATYVRTLPDVLRSQLARMAPDAVDKVAFDGVHGFAGRVLQRRGISARVDSAAIDQAFYKAWSSLGTSHPLRTGSLPQRYWRDEIDLVIKGRGLTSFDKYADLARIGRQHRLTVDQRRGVWELYVAYDRELRARGTYDFADRILLAAAELTREPWHEQYSAVIVDEAQDLTLSMVRMLYGLVGDKPDGFTLIGDGQQSIYPGGYTLAEAGINVAGRGVVLTTNYRNTAEILTAAEQAIAGSVYADIEGSATVHDREVTVPRHGSEPVIVTYSGTDAAWPLVTRRIHDVTRDAGTGIGDVAVLSPTNAGVSDIERELAKVGFATLNLTTYDGTPVDAVKVGTVKRAKGLEFKQVLVPGAAREWLDPDAAPRDPADLERWELSRRELYVAMTRARDGLWVGVEG